jgi:hypothetical protein
VQRSILWCALGNLYALGVHAHNDCSRLSKHHAMERWAYRYPPFYAVLHIAGQLHLAVVRQQHQLTAQAGGGKGRRSLGAPHATGKEPATDLCATTVPATHQHSSRFDSCNLMSINTFRYSQSNKYFQSSAETGETKTKARHALCSFLTVGRNKGSLTKTQHESLVSLTCKDGVIWPRDANLLVHIHSTHDTGDRRQT